MPAKAKKTSAKPRVKKESGLYVSRAMRAAAEAQAQAEIDARQKEADDYADAQDKLAYDAKYADRTPEQVLEFEGNSTTKALADARKKLKVDRTYKPSHA